MSGERESAETVASTVAAILDSPGAGPAELEEVARIQSATRRIVESGLGEEDERRLLSALARVAAKAALPTWALEAMCWVLREPEVPYPVPSERREWASRQLRRAGYDRCPTCWSEVPTEAELGSWANRRRWNTEALEVRARRDQRPA